ncbi:hypothetical protein H7T43_09280 [Peribacillus simplex]|uniref:hypothetical protein n=1 Tax=Peribacillus simplex TaxID=1478 RepID=UPI002989AD8F|nr:hypothetical protein [Peribacillus simplex]MBX9955107.1 hypothetical protein [Peribacillus simplex]
MLVKELLQRLENGETLRALALEVGVNPSTGLQRKMKRLGYVYDRSTAKWNWGGEGAEPLDADLSTEVATTRRQPSDKKKVKKTTTKVVHDEIRTTNDRQQVDNLTADELVAIRELIRSHQESAPAVADSRTLHDRIKEINREEKIRRNVFLNKTISDRLDEFCDRERVNSKSELIEIALQDLIDRYS